MNSRRKAAVDAAATEANASAVQPVEAEATSPQGGATAEGGDAGAVASATEPVSGLTPTKDPVRNAYGLELDRFGLPVNGPARAAVLAKMEVSDPALEPGEWDFRDGDLAAEVMEKIYG